LLGMLLSSTAVMARSSNLPDFTTMVEDVSPAVVNISASREVRQSSRRSIMEEFFGRGNPNRGDQPRRAESEGSGFIISDDGYVLTNKHVVEDADEVIVRIPDGREYTAKVIGEDEGTDVALLKIEADEKLPVLPTGDSDKLKVGEWVLGFGAPFGFDQTVTAGIVSAKRRTLLGREQYVPFIQTDVAINPGNSGGPLVSMDGKVVGINSQILSRDGGYLGISFAIPIETALHVANQFKRYDGQVKRGFLGVQYQDVTYKMAKTFGMDKVEGALLTMVTRGSAADEAGLQSGDIIVKLDGKYIRRAGELPFVVGLIEPGTEVRVEYVREGDRKKTKLTVGEREDPTRVAASESDPDNSLLGMVVEDMSEDMRRSSDVTGIVVRGVSPDGPAASADIRRGDILVSIARQQVESVAQFNELVEDLPRGEPIPALVVRANGLPTFVSINIPEE
jgi:serine protease Do